MEELNVVKLDELATLPTKAHDDDCGLDLYSCSGHIIPSESRSVVLVGTGISIEVPVGHGGFILPRSGLASRGVTIANSPGLIDPGYTGEVKIALINHGVSDFTVSLGDRIAQLVVLRFENFVPIERFLIRETERADGGFGSSGV